jgi:hypothetical protein
VLRHKARDEVIHLVLPSRDRHGIIVSE